MSIGDVLPSPSEETLGCRDRFDVLFFKIGLRYPLDVLAVGGVLSINWMVDRGRGVSGGVGGLGIARTPNDLVWSPKGGRGNGLDGGSPIASTLDWKDIWESL